MIVVESPHLENQRRYVMVEKEIEISRIENETGKAEIVIGTSICVRKEEIASRMSPLLQWSIIDPVKTNRDLGVHKS